MTSSFAGISTALSSLIAQRQGLDVAGQNLANANTVGYTRQRAVLSAVGGAQVPAMFATSSAVGNGVQVTGVDRLADAFVDARLRTATSDASYLAARTTSYSALETSLGEPAKTALSGQLADFWASWQDSANYPDSTANRQVVLTKAQAVVDKITTLANGVAGQWSDTYSSASALIDQVNSTASSIADLNHRILALTSSGSTANELQDQRDQLVTTLSGLVGASTNTRADGQIDVMVGGNALVSGAEASPLELGGARTYSQVAAGTPVTLSWANHPGVSVQLTGGTVAGQLTALAPPDATGTGGILAEAGVRLDAVAQALATSVNTLHATGQTRAGTPGGAVFTFGTGTPAQGLTLAITDPAALALADPTLGALDGSIGKKIAGLASSSTGADHVWSDAVVDIGSKTAAATSRSKVAEATRSTIASEQTAGASVDSDEETINMLAYQRAYQAAARVMTTIDSVLDTLINRMAV
ncbi:flagellar hook-associated protein FlgK [Cellulomonas citrea]|uniref:flagellar hook-associated protein FlgK n=1 Tax=Cellulomonas citrea TaxID=1909423 RepID=UPI00135A7273|nr:flagellar hook-associated protein FlgK [Cellulomonas citrea]